MAYSVFSYGSNGPGRASTGAVSPARAAAPDRKVPEPTAQEGPKLSNEPRAAVSASEQTARKTSTEAAADAAARREAQEKLARSESQNAAAQEQRADDIRKLEEIEAAALQAGTLRERRVAQLAHALIVRENAALRAERMEDHWRENQRREAARFLAAQAAAAYQQLAGFGGRHAGALIH
jgi:hypothetical protein